jgi:hypothetical protein
MIVLIAAGALVLGAIVYFLTHRGAAATAEPIAGTGFGDAVPAPVSTRPEGSPVDAPPTAFPAPDHASPVEDTPPPPPPSSGI